MKKYIGNLILIVFSTVFILAVLEIGTRLLFKAEYKTAIEYRMTQPEPYHNSDYFSKSFVKESFEHPGDWINPEGTRVLYPANYKSKYFNVEDNRRVTTDVPEIFSNNILLFGGSTIYNGEVPDRYTVASYLQRLLNEKAPGEYRVLNYGVSSINTSQQLERLKTIKIQAGDLVVFYGGVNDCWFFTSGRIDGWIAGENIVALGKLNSVQRIRFSIYDDLRGRSRFVSKFLNPYSDHVPDFLRDSSKIEQMKVDLEKSYIYSITLADSISKSNQATFYNFLQPAILTRSNKTPNEEDLLKNKILTRESWMLAMKYSYPVLMKSTKQLASRGLTSVDLTSLFDQSKDSHYLDYCHVTEKGNSLVATAISKTLLQSK